MERQTFAIELRLADAGYQEAAALEAALAELVKNNKGLTVTRFSPTRETGKRTKKAAPKPTLPDPGSKG